MLLISKALFSFIYLQSQGTSKVKRHGTAIDKLRLCIEQIGMQRSYITHIFWILRCDLLLFYIKQTKI